MEAARAARVRLPDEVCEGLGAHLLHHLGVVDLDGFFGNPQIEGHLLVQHAAD